MATKRKTAAQRRDAEIAALARRLNDMRTGAAGEFTPEDEQWDLHNPEAMARWVEAARAVFETEGVWTFRPWHIAEFASPRALAKKLHDWDVRANGGAG